MKKAQPVYLFAGGRGRTAFSTFSEIRKVIRSIGRKTPVIAFVGAAGYKDHWLVFILFAGLIKAGCRCRLLRVVIAPPRADLDKAKEILRTADAVFISGGDVDLGMQVLQEKNMVGFFRELAAAGQLFIGVSAGSIMLCREWVRWKDPQNDAGAELFSCLGIVDLICDTHAEVDAWAELKTVLKLKNSATGYGITSGACLKVFAEGRLEAANRDVIQLASVDGRIFDQPVLKPPSRIEDVR